VWHYQVNPREAWDYKATANMVSATLDIAGRKRKVLMQSPTNGFFYVLDRENGRLISAQKTGKVTWAERVDLKTGRPVEAASLRYEKGPVDIWPGPFGTHNWQRMSFSPSSGLAYIPYMHLGARYTAAEPAAAVAGRQVANLGGVSITPLLADANDGTGALLAWDPMTQTPRWRVPRVSLWNGGTLATAGGLVFQGTAEGAFEAYSAAFGERLWTFDARLGIVAAPMTYRVGVTQYVSILVGYGGATPIWSSLLHRGWKFNAQPRRLLTFALGAKAALPPTAARDFTVRALDDATLAIDADEAGQGASLYAAHCMMCHGGALLSAGLAPDLRESSLALEFAAFSAFVRSGALMARGMPRFDSMPDADLRKIHMYIRAGARSALRNTATEGVAPARL
jgi:quinohemoprotein ethanol dehydrogenase